MTMATETSIEKSESFKSEIKPDWCPGCGDFGVLSVLQRACAELGLEPHMIMVVSGIGCSSNLPGFFRSYGAHSLHGRALPLATGAKLANHSMTVIATGGDGDGYGIGCNHFIHSIRRNVNVTYIVMNNEIYGLTTGQVSPTSETGMKTKTTPEGNLELPINPLALALAAGCGYVARGFSGDPKHLLRLYVEGIRFPGFALIDVFSPCVTFNKQNTYQWFRERVYRLEDQDHNPADLTAATEKAREWGLKIPIGLFYKNPSPRPALEKVDAALTSGIPLVSQSLAVPEEIRSRLVGELG